MVDTLNKDGTPRKIGSGKTKGAGCFAKIKWEQLREFIQADDNILVSRVWLREVGALNQKKGSKKKLLTSLPLPKSEKKTYQSPAKPKSSHPKTSSPSRKSLDNEQTEGDDYSPPVFANIGNLKNY